MQILRPHFKTNESETEDLGAPEICFNKPSRWIWCMLKIENLYAKLNESKSLGMTPEHWFFCLTLKRYWYTSALRFEFWGQVTSQHLGLGDQTHGLAYNRLTGEVVTWNIFWVQSSVASEMASRALQMMQNSPGDFQLTIWEEDSRILPLGLEQNR